MVALRSLTLRIRGVVLMRSIASLLFTWLRASAPQRTFFSSPRDAHTSPRTCMSPLEVSPRASLRHALCFWVTLLGMSSYSTFGVAACLLAYDHAAPIEQGDLLGRAGSHLGGGVSDWGVGVEGQLGLSGDRSIHLRSGACSRSEVTGWAIETGVTQRLMIHRDHLAGDERAPYFDGPFDLGMRLTLVSFAGNQRNGESRSDLGVQAAALLSYPLWFDKRKTSGVGRVRFARAAVGVAIGLGSYASDRRQLVKSESPLNAERDTLLSSRWTWSELIAINAHYYLSDRFLLSAETRWAEGGLLAGLSIGYQL